MYYAGQVGDGVLDVFDSASRGALQGKNDHGIEVCGLLLSTEPSSGYDGTNSEFADDEGYHDWGLDADASRANPRQVLGYYRGAPVLPTEWPIGDRRRVVVLNLTNGSPSHAYREILVNQETFSAGGDGPGAVAAINSVMPPPAVTTFAEWVSGQSLPAGKDGPNDDPDHDGSVNLFEFFHGTNPLSGSSVPSIRVQRSPAGTFLVYQRAKDIGGFTLVHRTGTSPGATTAIADGALGFTTVDLGAVEEVTVQVPNSTDPARFYQLELILP